MTKKVKIILLLITLSVCLCLMSSTYSRYIASAKGDIVGSFSKWQIFINNEDITNGISSSLSITPTIIPSAHIKADVLAPTSQGYFDIEIDPSNVEVSFSYLIELDAQNDYIPDLTITDYAFLPEGYIEGNPLTKVPALTNAITEDKLFDKITPSFAFEPFTIRVFFEWYDGAGKIMTEEEQADIGYQAADEDLTYKIGIKASFEQITN